MTLYNNTIDPFFTLAMAPGVAGLGEGVSDGAATPLEGQDGSTGGSGGPARNTSPFGGIFPFLIIFMLLIMFLPMLAGRKEKKRKAALLASISKHDRVQTVGGVIGTVVEVRGAEIVLKVDEATNTKIRFARSSVQQVLKKAGASEPSSDVVEPAVAATA